jgi:hypothetical protein
MLSNNRISVNVQIHSKKNLIIVSGETIFQIRNVSPNISRNYPKLPKPKFGNVFVDHLGEAETLKIQEISSLRSRYLSWTMGWRLFCVTFVFGKNFAMLFLKKGNEEKQNLTPQSNFLERTINNLSFINYYPANFMFE